MCLVCVCACVYCIHVLVYIMCVYIMCIAYVCIILCVHMCMLYVQHVCVCLCACVHTACTCLCVQLYGRSVQFRESARQDAVHFCQVEMGHNALLEAECGEERPQTFKRKMIDWPQ